jgi:tRNA-dihydrouridine synthase A
MWEQLFVVLLVVVILKHSNGFTSPLDDANTRRSKKEAMEDSSSPSILQRKPLQFHVAPMQCYTNAPLRHLFRALSSDAVLWSEMEKVQDILEADTQGLERRFGSPGFQDHVLQLGGNNAGALSACVQRLGEKGYRFREINLNCGCPSIESGGASSFGASLMKQPALTRDLLFAIRSSLNTADTDVSLKCRIAVYENPDEMEPSISESQYQSLCDYVSHGQEAGISHLVLHARAAVLSGLNPSKNRLVPSLDYGIVERVAKDFPNLSVTLNGGITALQQLENILGESCNTQEPAAVSSYMAGRWMLRRPLDLAQVHHKLLVSGTCASSELCSTAASETTLQAVNRYVKYVKQNVSSSSSGKSGIPSIADLCLPLYLITEQLREDYDEIEHTNIPPARLREEDMESLYDILRDATNWLEDSLGAKKKIKSSSDHVQFKKLSSSFKGLVGTKVANKWKRNRAEL